MYDGASIARPCRPRQLCRRWRECERCARIRQAKFADAAERAAAMMVAPGLTVLIPHDGTRASAERLRRWYAEKVKPIAAVWSIEYGHHGTGHHLNVIADLVADLAPPAARVLSSPIRSTVRATAAYITKRKQAPPMQSGRERNTGYMGNVIDTIAEQSACLPVLQAAARQQQALRDADTTEQLHEQDSARLQSQAANEWQRASVVGLQHLHAINERIKRDRAKRLKGELKQPTSGTKKPASRFSPPPTQGATKSTNQPAPNTS